MAASPFGGSFSTGAANRKNPLNKKTDFVRIQGRCAADPPG
jgi:hypothetical protein